jgi:hypothetical protein
LRARRLHALDAGRVGPYIGSAMNRIILALLALFAGLAAQSTPAQARLSGTDTIVSAVESARSARQAPVQTQGVDEAVARQERRERQASRVRSQRSTVYIPSVLFGADRAFE